MECMSVCWPDQLGRSRALRRKRQSAVMTMTGGARRRHPRMSGRFFAAMGGRPYQWSSEESATKTARCCPGEHGRFSGTKAKIGDEAERAAPKNECAGQQSSNQVSADKETSGG